MSCQTQPLDYGPHRDQWNSNKLQARWTTEKKSCCVQQKYTWADGTRLHAPIVTKAYSFHTFSSSAIDGHRLMANFPLSFQGVNVFKVPRTTRSTAVDPRGPTASFRFRCIMDLSNAKIVRIIQGRHPTSFSCTDVTNRIRTKNTTHVPRLMLVKSLHQKQKKNKLKVKSSWWSLSWRYTKMYIVKNKSFN